MGAFVTVLAERPGLCLLAGNGAVVKRQGPDKEKSLVKLSFLIRSIHHQRVTGKVHYIV